MSSSLGYEPNLTADGECPLFAANVARKRAEQDAMLLANRLALLRAEERKAAKKIDETKKKAQDILQLREKNKEIRMLRDKALYRRQEDMQNLKEVVDRRKGEMRRDLHQQREVLQQSKHSEYVEMKNQRQAISQYLRRQNDDRVMRARSLKHEIQEREAMTQAMRRASMARKQQIARENFEEKVKREEEVRREKEAWIAAMEKEEMELIEKLHKTQQRQRSAYDELEGILQTSTPADSLSRAGKEDTTRRAGSARKLGQKEATSACTADSEESRKQFKPLMPPLPPKRAPGAAPISPVVEEREEFDLAAALNE